MTEATLEIDRLSKRYGELVALNEMTFDVRSGELFGFVGSNGAGKTTTMRIAMGVLATDSGEVRWQGRPVDFDTRRKIGYMPSERGLYPKMKVHDQLVYLGELHGMVAADARRAADEWTERLGLAERRKDEVQKLSLGNQQRVQLAAALIHDPEVLILDEPFSGLDPMAVDVMSSVLREKASAGAPVIFSSHQLELVERFCDRVGIIRSGEMVACGTVDELRGDAALRIRIDVPSAQPGWNDAIAGVRLIEQTGSVHVVELSPGVDDQRLLAAALATGPVREFSPHRPALTELFRNVVSQEVAQ
ncbi:ABC-2 type transport system ATP-binding protein [Actinoalloteichus hoggarensis]|uniref:Putative ABC transporter ATP-binding protein YbhF n=1 Tax=Actinoalloteichus hoggarensis TaxID=1470176 RepID=A0A221W9R8_9PSEU|nr:ATP-binding cassette domain-containing protein [Actinoalloteichus hoggarensis]ASO22808.1 putative ABC transporter ATP-binding protein YbhF [Actinoalloteichus hoggarensis]MBB5924050.1 ABC-2 type transport system ATP-binding protein [Actinoalloteichus hoggarensis]